MGVLPRPPPRRLRRAGAAVTGPARPPPGRPARLARPLLRGPDRDHPRRGPPRLGRRRQQLPRLLRRHPHHDDRARPARGHQGGRASRPGGSSTPRRSTSTGRWSNSPSASPSCPASPTPGSSSPPPAPRPTTPPCCSPPPTGGPTRSWRCATATTAGPSARSASPATRGWSPTCLSPLQTLYVHGGVRTRGPYAELSDAEFIAACVADLKDLLGHTRAPAALIAEPDPGRRRLHLTARRAVRGLPRGPRPARHPVDRRRGADRLGPHRRALLGLAGARRARSARHPHLRQGHRQRHVHRRRRRPRRDHELPGRQLHLDLRRYPGHHGGRPRQPLLPPGTRPPGQRPARRRAAHRAAAGRRRAGSAASARCAGAG